jgi:predicted amidophosphoribosyltransferase
MEQILEWLSHFFFPSLCLSCECRVEKRQHLFCIGCKPYFEMLSPIGRCKYCFNESASTLCQTCRKERQFIPKAAVFMYAGGVKALIQAIKREKKSYLQRTAADFLLAQWHILKWPVPDQIIPIPGSITRKDSTYYLSYELSKRFKVPFSPILKRENCNQQFILRKKIMFEGRNVLLISDIFKPDFKRAFDVLSLCFPRKIFSLSLAF